MSDAETFWRDLPFVLSTVDGMQDDAGAEALVEFLEEHREAWTAIVTAMRASSAKRALFEKACLLLAEHRTDERLES